MNFKDQRVMITGAAGGIGTELVALLAARGARLCLLNRGAASVASLQERARRLGTETLVLQADVTVAAERQQALSRMRSAFGGIDVLINLAGMVDFHLLAETDPAIMPRLLAVNLEAPMQMAREVVPEMIERGRGRIVNMGSMFGSIGFPGFSLYSASKFALRGFSQALRRELSGSGVGVTYVSPRAVRTPFNPEVVHRMAERGMMHMDEPARVAVRTLHAIERDRDEAYLGFPESLFARLNGLFPRLIDRALRKDLPSLIAYTREAH